MVLQAVFWICFFMLLHSYVIYPLSLILLSKNNARQDEAIWAGNLPKVSILVSAYNEEKEIDAKISNIAQINYPTTLIEFLIGVDGAQDRTAEIVRCRNIPRLKLYDFPERRGKVAVLNELAELAGGEILLFTDANTELDNNALNNLVKHFESRSVGGVCGRLVLRSSKIAVGSAVESLYWRFESLLKELEGNRGAALGANGGIYAVRKSCFVPFETKFPIADDFVLPLKIIEKGYEFIYEPSALAFEESGNFVSEFKRKVRIGAQDFNALRIVKPLLNPSRGFVAYAMWSHKIFRWFVPHFLLLAFFSNLFLVSHGGFLYFTMLMQISFYLAALIGTIGLLLNKNIPIFAHIGYFVSANAALFVGFIKAIFKIQGTKWEVSRD